MLEKLHASDLSKQVLESHVIHPSFVDDFDGHLDLCERMLCQLDDTKMAPIQSCVYE